MIGALAGDIIGSVYEHRRIKTKDLTLFHPHCRFTDDSVLTIAIAQAILDGKTYLEAVRCTGLQYPDAGYGGSVIEWLYAPDPKPYRSWGNGSAMRASPVGWAFDSVEAVLREAARTAEITHNHPEGIKGAQAVALAVFLGRTTHDKGTIKKEKAERFGYNLERTVDEIRPAYRFDVSRQGTVPEAIIAFLDATSYEDAVRNAISLGGDSDTLACISGAIAEAHFGPVPEPIRTRALALLTPDLRRVTQRFCSRYLVPW
ncbi:MAG: ADP-ribosylglycohydrolase family protein [Anaerolineae bacterium]